jgi:hypothetical protein
MDSSPLCSRFAWAARSQRNRRSRRPAGYWISTGEPARLILNGESAGLVDRLHYGFAIMIRRLHHGPEGVATL